jgi:hypothetical protein
VKVGGAAVGHQLQEAIDLLHRAIIAPPVTGLPVTGATGNRQQATV